MIFGIPLTDSQKILMQIFTHQKGGDYFYSLSMNSSAVGGSGLRPFLFLISAISVA